MPGERDIESREYIYWLSIIIIIVTVINKILKRFALEIMSCLFFSFHFKIV